MAAGLEPLVVFWKAQGIQVLVLLSLALQVTLLVSAEIRRRKDSGLLRAVVWSAYLLADTTATYALGHMSVVTTSPGHELAAFWAPFLLLHLGGQDNITAYSIEDNRLWLRHLQSFAVQVLVAAYVLYDSSILLAAGGGLRQAAILMSVVGVVKYGERVWALRRAGSSNLSGKNYQSFGRVRIELYHRPDEWRAEAFRAHLLLNLPKHLLKGPLPVVAVDMDGTCGWELMYRVAEMQLSLMYDVLYTKAELIHSCYGYCVRVASLAATVAASLLFHRFAGSGKDDGYSRVDVAATYVLLAGAVALEITSVLRAMLSSWKYTLVTRERTPASLVLAIVVCLPSWPFELARSAMRRRGGGGRGTHTATKYWSGSMGQHSFIHMCSRTKGSRSSKVARWAEREDWWNMLAYTSSVPVSGHISQLLKKQVMQSAGVEGDSPDHIHSSRGRAALKRRGLHEELGWSVGAELDESILVWHVATHVYLRWHEARARRPPALARATEEISNYMMFLLAARPHMLPDNVSRQRYVELCDKVINHLGYSSADDLLRLIRDRGDKLGNGGQRRPAGAGAGAGAGSNATFQGNVTFDRAAQLGAKLISKELETPDANMLELISQVWVENGDAVLRGLPVQTGLSCQAAEQRRRDHHHCCPYAGIHEIQFSAL